MLRCQILSRKRLSPSRSRQALALTPMGSLRKTVILAVAQPTFVLARFQLRLHLGNGLMQPHERLFSYSCLLPVPPILSRGKLNACCMVRLTELGLPIVQHLADALRACGGDRCQGMSSRIV